MTEAEVRAIGVKHGWSERQVQKWINLHKAEKTGGDIEAQPDPPISPPADEVEPPPLAPRVITHFAPAAKIKRPKLTEEEEYESAAKHGSDKLLRAMMAYYGRRWRSRFN